VFGWLCVIASIAAILAIVFIVAFPLSYIISRVNGDVARHAKRTDELLDLEDVAVDRLLSYQSKTTVGDNVGLRFPIDTLELNISKKTDPYAFFETVTQMREEISPPSNPISLPSKNLVGVDFDGNLVYTMTGETNERK
jgi:hypothetical protein